MRRFPTRGMRLVCCVTVELTVSASVERGGRSATHAITGSDAISSIWWAVTVHSQGRSF
jgi:hypothetical protein